MNHFIQIIQQHLGITYVPPTIIPTSTPRKRRISGNIYKTSYNVIDFYLDQNSFNKNVITQVNTEIKTNATSNIINTNINPIEKVSNKKFLLSNYCFRV